MINEIYPSELQLNKTNSSDTEASFQLYQVVWFSLNCVINARISILYRATPYGINIIIYN